MPINAKIPKGYEALRPQWEAFGAFVDLIGARLAAEGDEMVDIAALDGDLIGRVSLADVRRKFAAIDWSLTTKDAKNGGAGSITSAYKSSASKPASWLSGKAAFHVDGFRDYATHDEAGLHYLALHETSHVSLLGLQVQDACWRKYLKEKGKPKTYAGSPYYLYNEQVANEIVRVLAGKIGVETLAAPTYGSPPVRLKLGLKIA